MQSGGRSIGTVKAGLLLDLQKGAQRLAYHLRSGHLAIKGCLLQCPPLLWRQENDCAVQASLSYGRLPSPWTFLRFAHAQDCTSSVLCHY